MWMRSFFLFLIGFAVLSESNEAFAREIPPPPRTYLYQETEVLNSADAAQVSGLLENLDQETGHQVVIAVFQSLQDEDLVDFTNRVFQAWKMGRAGKDDGVLVAFYKSERKVRIEVGYGFEAVLTDALSKRIIETAIVPAIQKGGLGAGVFTAAAEVTAVARGLPADDSRRVQGRKVPRAWVNWIFLTFLFLLFRLILWADSASGRGVGNFRSGGLRRGGWGGGLGGGGFGGGGFGSGGGFGGGGGSSGGGGASGGW